MMRKRDGFLDEGGGFCSRRRRDLRRGLPVCRRPVRAGHCELREDYATRAQALEAKYREKERTYAQSLVEAWEVRDAALARASDLSGDLDRVRREADAARRRLSAAAGGACKSEREQLARCADLLERGTELVRRGVSFLSGLR